MKLRTSNLCGLRSEWTCVDDETYAGPGSLIGTGATEQEAKDHYMEQWVAKQVDDDIARAKPALQSWDEMLRKLVFGGPRS